MAVKGLVIWAHSMCRSTFDLYREVVRQAPVPVKLAFRQGPLACRLEQGFSSADFASVPSVVIGDDRRAADALLAKTVGWVQVVTAYQVSRVFRHVMRLAHGRGDRVVVYSEAPCEMCLGAQAALKRLYYRWILPGRVRDAVRSADLFLSASGNLGKDRLERLGWPSWKIVPFGYASPRLPVAENVPSPPRARAATLRVVHLGGEAPYRRADVAVKAARRAGVELVRTGGKISLAELANSLRSADLVVGCGWCEPWGMRINDALLEGIPVIVSDGMGVAWAVEKYGCGCVVPRGDVRALAAVLARCKSEPDFLARLKSGAQVAARALVPERRARDWLEAVCG